MESAADSRFPKRSRLIRPAEFDRVKQNGTRRGGEHLAVWALANGLTHPRLGLAVSRKVGKSHDRNRFKRRVRELFRQHLLPTETGVDYLVVARNGALELDFSALSDQLSRVLSALKNNLKHNKKSPPSSRDGVSKDKP